MIKTSTVWPGAEIDDSSAFSHWFGILAFYSTCLFLLLLVAMLIAMIIYLIRNWNDPSKW